jgi:hypothetical protein
MQMPRSVNSLENLGRVRLSKSFFMRDFLYSEIANFHKIQNIPEDPDLAIAAGKHLCEEILEPLRATFGRISIRSGYRSPDVNRFGNEHDLNCSSNEANYAGHIWDKRDASDCAGATACIVVNWYLEQYEETQDFRPLAWWIHDHLPYARMEFFPKLCAFNIGWHEKSRKASILSYATPRGYLTKIGVNQHEGDHSDFYQGFPKLKLA